MGTILLWIVLGAIAGWIASSLMGVREGFWGNVLIGIVGAVLGGWIFSMLGISRDGSVLWSLISAIVGAVILLAIVGALRRPRAVMSP